MKAIKRNMRDAILDKDTRILHCPLCDYEASGNSGDYWHLPDDYVFKCPDCDVELELVHEIVTVRYDD